MFEVYTKHILKGKIVGINANLFRAVKTNSHEIRIFNNLKQAIQWVRS